MRLVGEIVGGWFALSFFLGAVWAWVRWHPEDSSDAAACDDAGDDVGDGHDWLRDMWFKRDFDE